MGGLSLWKIACQSVNTNNVQTYSLLHNLNVLILLLQCLGNILLLAPAVLVPDRLVFQQVF